VEQAREEATRILAKAELGEDVALERARARAEMTISDLCDEYMREASPRLSGRTRPQPQAPTRTT
jgi:vacuolar-type H+-ATPase subunit H